MKSWEARSIVRNAVTVGLISAPLNEIIDPVERTPNAEYQAKFRNANIAKGLCPCGRNPVPERRRCERCAAQAKASNDKRYARRRAAGLCPMCGGKRDDDRSWCSPCRYRNKLSKPVH